jgi:hypothetical protein
MAQVATLEVSLGTTKKGYLILTKFILSIHVPLGVMGLPAVHSLILNGFHHAFK